MTGQSIYKKIKENKWILRSLLYSIYFNFHYLPLKQAIKLPILLYKPKFVQLKGKVIISTSTIKTGMIQLGKNTVSIYPNTGITIEIKDGGILIFNGSCRIGNNSYLSIGEKGKVEIGNQFCATTTLRIVSYHSIIFGNNVSVGWECTFMDTDLHKMIKINRGYTKGYAPIKIGNNNWITTKCHVLKRSETPDFCTISTGSILNKKYDYPPYTVIGGNPAREIAHGVYRDLNDDIIKYE